MEKTTESSTFDARNSALKGVGWMAISASLWQGLSWIITLLTARLLLPADYGSMAMLETIAPYLALVSDLSISTWLVQEKSLDERKLGTLWSLSLILGSSLFLFTIVIASVVADFYQNPALVLGFQLLGFTFLLRAFAVIPESLLKRNFQFKEVALVNISTGICRGVLQITLAYKGYGFWALLTGFVAGDIFRTIILLLISRPNIRFSWDSVVWRTVIRFALPATASAVCWVVFSTFDNILVGRFFGAEILGFYAMAFYLADLPLSKTNTITRPVLMTYFGRLRDNSSALVKEFHSLVHIFSLLLFPVYGGLFITADIFIPLLLGDSWTQLILPLKIFCVLGFIKTSIDLFAPLLLSLNAPGRLLQINLITLIGMFFSFLVLCKYLGVNGLYVAWLSVYPILALFSLRVISPLVPGIGLSMLKSLKLAFVSTAVMTISIHFLSSFLAPLHPAAQLGVMVLTGASLYAAVVRLFIPNILSEIRKLFRPQAA